MAKISKIQVHLFGEIVELPINCSSKGIFSTVYPPGVVGIVGYRNAALTRDELEMEIHKVVAEANSMATTVEDVILYRLESYGKRYHDTGDWQRASILLEYAAVRIQVTGKSTKFLKIQRKYHNSLKDDKLGLPEGWVAENIYSEGWGQRALNPSNSTQIPFTVESISFFENFEKSIVDLGKKMAEALTPEAVQELTFKGLLPELASPLKPTPEQ